MSSESVDPQLIEQTKQQILSLMNEIKMLTKQELTLREFYGEFLTRVVNALAATGGAVWSISETGALDLEYQIRLNKTKLPENQEALQRHQKLLQKVATTGQPALIAPHSGEGNGEQAGNATDYLLVLAPVKVDQVTKSIVEIFQRPNSPPTTQRGYLRFLIQVCELASDYLKTHQLRHFTDRQTLWNQLENFTRVAHTSLDPREAAFTIANEGRRLIECDRVSVAIKRGRKVQIEAISGQDTFDKRSNTVSLLNRLASAVVATGEAMWYSGDTSAMAPQVEDAVQAYVDDSHSKNVAVLPLKRTIKNAEDDKETAETIGAIIVEQIEDARPREGMVQRVSVVCDHSSTALSNALEHNSLFLMPLWRSLGKSKWIVSARTLPKTIAICAVVLAALIALAVVPADFNLQGKGKLWPELRRQVFAAHDGTVTELLVQHGDRVKKGQLLARLKNYDLLVALEDVRGQTRAAEEDITSLSITLSQSGVKSEDRVRLQGQKASLEKKLESLAEQSALLEEKLRQLEIRSTIDGEIMDWDLEKVLLNRPVKQGQVLFNVAEPNSQWELEVHMPEDRMGHIEQARNDIGEDLKVTYILATNSGDREYGSVREVHLSAEVMGDEGNIVLMKVDIDKADLPEHVRPGADVTAKVYCGRRAVGYVWFHDLIAFMQSRVFFPFF